MTSVAGCLFFVVSHGSASRSSRRSRSASAPRWRGTYGPCDIHRGLAGLGPSRARKLVHQFRHLLRQHVELAKFENRPGWRARLQIPQTLQIQGTDRLSASPWVCDLSLREPRSSGCRDKLETDPASFPTRRLTTGPELPQVVGCRPAATASERSRRVGCVRRFELTCNRRRSSSSVTFR
jgi:hypothetical protein